MFLEELTPILGQLTQHPVSFMGGFVTGLLRLNLSEDPVRSWLDQQLGASVYTSTTTQVDNGKTRVQTIVIE